MIVHIRRLHPDAIMPQYQTDGASGMDLHAVCGGWLHPRERDLFLTGIAIAVPAGYEAQVRPRSGLALKHGVTVLNAPGTIDSDYTGEIGAILYNSSDEPFFVEAGMRIAQLVVAAVERVELAEVDELPETERGAGGYGSTGSGT